MSAAPRLVSAREFARLDGCDDKLVRRAVKAGKLPASDDGRIDAALAGSAWRRQNRRTAETADNGADKAKVSAANVRSRAVSAPPAEQLIAAIDKLTDEEATDFLTAVLAGEYRDTGTAEKIKENALAAKHLLAVRKEANNLIEVERAEAIFFEMARADRDAWMNFPTRIGPLLAADLDLPVDRVVEALTAHVQQQLEQLGEPEPELVTT